MNVRVSLLYHTKCLWTRSIINQIDDVTKFILYPQRLAVRFYYSKRKFAPHEIIQMKHSRHTKFNGEKFNSRHEPSRESILSALLYNKNITKVLIDVCLYIKHFLTSNKMCERQLIVTEEKNKNKFLLAWSIYYLYK